MEQDEVPPPEGELVETGSFRVDPERMLQKLSQHQFATPLHFIRALARCAAASGASAADLRPASGPLGTGFEFGFDGKSFTRGQLADIYSPLLAGEAGRGRYLAAAALALLRTAPGSLTVCSGQNVVELAVGGKHQVPRPAEDGRTVIRAMWWHEPPGLAFKAVAAELAGNVGLCPFRLTCPGEERKSWAEYSAEISDLHFEKEGRRGSARRIEQEVTPLTGFHPEQDSSISVFVHGVFAETHQVRMPLAPVSILVNDDGLNLDVSMNACVKDARFSELKAFALRICEELVFHEIRLQRQELPFLGDRLKEPAYVKLWRAKMKWQEAWTSASSLSSFRDLLPGFIERLLPERTRVPPDGHRLAAIGDRHWWLQDACRRALRGHVAEPMDRLRQELWRAPVLLSTCGMQLSLGDIIARRERNRLLVSKKVSAERPAAPEAVWLASFRDERFLNEFVPEKYWWYV